MNMLKKTGLQCFWVKGLGSEESESALAALEKAKTEVEAAKAALNK